MGEDLPEEEWREVVGHEGYEVSNLGRVRSYRMSGRANERFLQEPKIRKPVPAKKRGGYLTLTFIRDGKAVYRYVHHLVLEAFVGPCPPGMQARHADDRDVTNNALSNLRWGTLKENAEDKIRHGTSQHGERNHQAKLTDAQVAEIRASQEKLRALAARYGVRESQISRIRNGVRRAGL